MKKRHGGYDRYAKSCAHQARDGGQVFDLENRQRRLGAQRFVQMFAHTAAARKLDDGMTQHVAQTHARLASQGMVRAAHQKVAVRVQEFALQIRHVRPPRGHGKIGHAALHHVQARIEQGVAQVQHDARVILLEPRQQIGQPTRRQRRQRGQCHPAPAPVRQVAQVAHCQVHVRQQPARGRIQHTAFGSQLHVPRVAVKEPHAGGVFQRPDQRAERGLRQVAALRGAREVPFIGQGHEGAQLAGR